MREALSGSDLFSLLLLMRSGRHSVLFVVEGASDAAFFSLLVGKTVDLVPGYGREKVLFALRLVEETSLVDVVAVVDADFWRIDGIPNLPRDVLLADYHDRELMVCASAALAKVEAMWCSPAKVLTTMLSRGVDSLLNVLLESTRPIGALRLLSERQSLSLVFDGLRYESFIDSDTLETSIPRLVEVVLQRSAVPLTRAKETEEAIAAILAEGWPPLELCSGHDVLSVFAIGLRRALASHTGRDAMSAEQLDRALAVAYEIGDFQSTRLFADIEEWAKTHARVLRP